MAHEAEKRVHPRFSRTQFDNELKENVQKLLDAIAEGGRPPVPDMSKGRENFKPNGDAFVGYDRFTSQEYNRTSYSLFCRLKEANPYLDPLLRGHVDRISTKMITDCATTLNDGYIRIMAFGNICREHGESRSSKGDSYARLARDMLNQEEQARSDFFTLAATADASIRYLSGESIQMSDRQLGIAKEQLGIDLRSPEIQEARGKMVRPERTDFTVQNSPLVDPLKFTAKMASDRAQTLNPDELEYGIATFDRNMNGLYGSGMSDVRPGRPMFLGKFDYIHIDGKSVTELCRNQTQGMSELERSDYMKCYTTAAAMSLDKRMECALPPVSFTKDNDGNITRQFSKASGEGAKVIPMTAKVEEYNPTPRPNIIKRILAKIGLYHIRTFQDKQQEYEEMLENDPEQEERGKKIERTMIQQAVVEQCSGISQDGLRAAHDIFFNPEDLERVNPGLSEFDKWNPETINGAATLTSPGRRTSLAMAYMFSKGYPLEQIIDPEAIPDEKRECGREMYEILAGGDPQAVGEMYAGMIKSIADMQLPDIDYTNDAQLAEKSAQLRFMTSAYINVDQSSQFSSPATREAYSKALGDRGKNVASGLMSSATFLKQAIASRLDYIESSDYSPEHATREGERSLRGNELSNREALRTVNETPGVKGAKLRQLDMGQAIIRQTAYINLCASEIDERLESIDDKQTTRYLNGETADNPFGQIEQKAADAARAMLPDGDISVKDAAETSFEVQRHEPDPERTIAVEPAAQELDFATLAAETLTRSTVVERSVETAPVEEREVSFGKS